MVMGWAVNPLDPSAGLGSALLPDIPGICGYPRRKGWIEWRATLRRDGLVIIFFLLW